MPRSGWANAASVSRGRSSAWEKDGGEVAQSENVYLLRTPNCTCEMVTEQLGVEMHDYNPSYSGGRQEDFEFKANLGNIPRPPFKRKD